MGTRENGVEAAIGSAIDAGLRWLLTAQAQTGEFPSYASALGGEPDWQLDSLNFVTALTSLALADIDDERVRRSREAVTRFLVAEREGGSLWRYWSKSAELHDYTPPDADDTACCSLAIGSASRANRRTLLANRDRHGRFYTWFVLHPEIRNPRYRWLRRSERDTEVLARRDELWSNSEASPDDVDVTVNANVIRYLGPRHAPAPAVEWVASVVERGTEIEDDHWYRSRTSLYRSVAVAGAAGIERFSGLRPVILDRLLSDPGPDALRSDLERADGLRVLCTLAAPPDVLDTWTQDLLRRQRPDGRWERSICYFGGPQESFGWASEALTTATAIGALRAAATALRLW